jgi:Bacterial Ig domain
MSRAWLALLVVVALSGVTASGADFTASSTSPSNSFAAAADFNTVAVSMTDPGSPLSGTVGLQATASSDRGIDRVRFQSSPAGAGTWTDACEDTTAPYDCNWNTAGVADGSRDLRAVAVDQAGYQRTAVVAARMVDNTAPTVSVPDPGPLRGTVSVAVDATDGAGTGVASVTTEFRPAGGGAWTEVCTDTTAPFGCDGLDTTQVPDGLYDVRATAVDGVGLSATSALRTVRVDNGVPSATLTDPGTPLQGSVALTGTASDAGSGIVSWTVQHRPAGGGAWTDVCSATASPFTCTWDTTAVADALYDVRAVARDAAGNEFATTPVANRSVDNTAPNGTDVQTGNAGTAGRFGINDWIRLTWTEQIAPASVLSGWTGTSQAITVRVTNNGNNDRMDFYNAGDTTRLNLVNGANDLQLGGNFVTADKTFTGTMEQSGASITITFGTVSGARLSTAAAGTMTWRPSGTARDLAGNASSTATVTEPGALDVDF